MTSADIVTELRATRPVASAALRTRVTALVERSPAATPGLLTRLGARRRLLIALPVAGALGVATVFGIAQERDPASREALPSATSSRADATSAGATEAATPLPPAGPALGEAKAGGTAANAYRAQSFAATLTLEVANGDAVGAAAQRALATVDELGGFVVGSQVATGESGYAAITLKVPFDRAQDAVVRLSRLGTIVTQDVRIQDLQEAIDAFDRQIRITRNQLAAVLARLATELTDPAFKARLEARRDALREELRGNRSGRSSTAAQGRLATIQLELRSDESAGVIPVGSRIDRTLDRALEILAWEGAIAAALLIVASPIALLLGALWLGRRTFRRRDDERLLAAS